MKEGRIIEVHRQFNSIQMAQSDPQVKEWLAQQFRAIGPYFTNDGKAVATGLNFDEQKVLLPNILGIEHSDKDFRKAVTNFYHEINTKVPSGGLKLQIALEDENKPLSESNLPINVKDYIAYRHLIGHRDVAKNKDEAERYQNKQFYVVDPNSATKEAVKINQLEDKAFSLYMSIKDSIVRTDQVLTMLGVRVSSMVHEDKVLSLKEFASKDSTLNDLEQQEAFLRFIRVCEDKDLEHKYLIEEMIAAQYLRRVGNNILFSESGEKLGDNMEDAVLYLKNPKFSKEANIMRAKYELLVKKESEYLPKQEKEAE